MAVVYTSAPTPHPAWTPADMFEINPVLHRLDDLRGRTEALRGYL